MIDAQQKVDQWITGSGVTLVSLIERCWAEGRRSGLEDAAAECEGGLKCDAQVVVAACVVARNCAKRIRDLSISPPPAPTDRGEGNLSEHKERRHRMKLKPVADEVTEFHEARLYGDGSYDEYDSRLTTLINRCRDEGRQAGLEDAAVRCEMLVREDDQIVGSAAGAVRRCAEVIRWMATPSHVATDSAETVSVNTDAPQKPAPQKMTPEHLGHVRWSVENDVVLVKPSQRALISHIAAQEDEISRLIVAVCEAKADIDAQAAEIEQLTTRVRLVELERDELTRWEVHQMGELKDAHAEIQSLTDRLQERLDVILGLIGQLDSSPGMTIGDHVTIGGDVVERQAKDGWMGVT